MEKGKETYKLPEGWIEATLEEIAILSTGNTPSKKYSNYYGGDFPFYKPSDLDSGIVYSAKETLTDDGKRVARIIPSNTILVTSIGATIGKTGIVKEEGAFNQQINAIIPIISLPLFYYYQILESTFQRKLKENSSATTVPIINKTKFGKLVLKLAPIKEQHRIVSKIESLFSELDQAEKGLKKAKQQLEVYRQALLKSAFEGKLTESWRKDNYQESAEKLFEQIKEERQKTYLKEIAGWNEALDKWEKDGKKGKKPQKPSNNSKVKPLNKNELSKLFPLPQTALWIKIGDVTLRTEYGSSAKSNNIGKIPVLRMGNIQNGKFDWSSLVFTSSTDEINQYLLKYNDVLFNRTNSSELVGKTAIYKGERPAIFAGYLIRINQIASLCNADFLN